LTVEAKPMNRIINNSPQVTLSRRVRLHQVERRLANLDAALHTIGVALWQTDLRLNLLDCMGLAVAEGYLGRPIVEFYRDVCGLTGTDMEPIRAHEDALKGQSVTLHWLYGGEQFLLMVEGRRDQQGQVIGTVGLSLRLGAAM
jgi:hypothetical protein